MFGEKEFGKTTGYPTPENTPEEATCLTLLIPASSAWWAIYSGLLISLSDENAWQQFEGGMTREDAAAEAFSIFNDAMERANTDNCALSVPSPYWETGLETDDEMPVDSQIWYGYVSEGNFIEDFGVWTISNFLASTLTPTAAILYATHQRKVRLAFLKGGLGGVVSVYVGEALAAVVNLFGDEGDVEEIEIITGYVDDAVEILQILDSIP